jgi:hypothetical protein
MVIGQFPRNIQRSDTSNQPRLQYPLALNCQNRFRNPAEGFLGRLR